MIFHTTSIWSSGEASKFEAPKSNLLNKSFSHQEILADLLGTEMFKDGLSSRLRLYEKSWGLINYWAKNLKITIVQMKTFLNWQPLLQGNLKASLN